MKSFLQHLGISLTILLTLSDCDQRSATAEASAAPDITRSAPRSSEQDVTVATGDVASTTIVDTKATPVSPPPPKSPACPNLPDIPPDNAGKPAVNPAGCPADGLGNFYTWVYLAWKKQMPIWTGHAIKVTQVPGKWYPLQNKTVWADTIEVTFTLVLDQELFLSPGTTVKEHTMTKPGCYPWALSDQADQWTKNNFGANKKYCINTFNGKDVLAGDQFLFFGGFPSFDRVLSLKAGKLLSTESKLANDIEVPALKASIATALAP